MLQSKNFFIASFFFKQCLSLGDLDVGDELVPRALESSESISIHTSGALVLAVDWPFS